MQVSACLVTRGDVDMTVILNSLPFDDVIVWDNSVREDLKCYGRFAAVAEAKHDIIYTQDDDLMVPIPALLRAWDDDRGILANKPVGEEWLFLGCGSLFNKSLVAPSFDRYLEAYAHEAGTDELHKTADVVFAYQNPYRSVWLGYLDFPWQTADNRMYKDHDHYGSRSRTRDKTLCLTV